jgi:hypothetical protein
MSERTARRTLLVTLVLFVGMGLAYAVTTPTLEAPDEIHHYDYIRSLVNAGRPPAPEADGGRGFGHHGPLYYVAGALVSFGVGEDDLDLWRARYNPFFGYRFGDVGRDNKNIYLHPDDDRFGASDTWLGVRLVRAFSVLIGAATVWVIYRIGREVFPERPEIAVGAAGLAAFIPEFLFISGAVNDDNAAALCGSLALWAMTRLVLLGPTNRRAAALGFALAAGWLAKLTTISLVPAAGLTLLLVAYRRGSWRDLFRYGLVTFSVMLLFVLPWLIRQTITYDDPTGTSGEFRFGGERERPIALADLGPDLFWLRTTFWGRLGANQIPMDGWIYRALDAMTVIAILGLLRLAVLRLRQEGWDPRGWSQSVAAVFPHGASILLLAGPLIGRRFLRPMPNFGRYLFPALPAIAIFFVLGLLAWTPRRWGGRVLIGLGTLMAALGLSTLLFYLAPAYARPPIYDTSGAPEPAHRLDWVFLENKRPLARLLGFDVGQEAVEPAETVQVTLYWEVLGKTPLDYVLFAQLFGREGLKVGQRDTYPGLGHYPTSFWHPGQIIVDEVPISVDPEAVGPSRLRLDVGLYRRGDGQRLQVVDAANHEVGAATVGWLKLASIDETSQPAVTTDYRLGAGIALAGYALEADIDSKRLTIFWSSQAPMAQDYTVFVHLDGTDGTLAGLADGPPVGGDYPTSLWSPGEMIVDERLIFTEGIPPGTYRLSVGMYLPETGERLPATDADGARLPDDRVPLMEVDLP